MISETTDAWLFRYEKASGDNNGFGGEHFSVVLEKKSRRILGITWMDQSLSEGQLPSTGETLEIAKDFLDKVEPGLFNQLENLWIDRHKLLLYKERTGYKPFTISGMKYKCYRQDEDNYAWVIAGPGGQVITFEQGIVWENGRVTEKWLHDNWVKQG